MDEDAEVASRLAAAVIASRKKPATAEEAVAIYREVVEALKPEFSGFMPEAGDAR